jgi:iron complex outermembrane recepter protein
MTRAQRHAQYRSIGGLYLKTVLAVLGGLPCSVMAVDEGGDSTAVQEIVVTARKRAESLESVPLSITAFSADTLEKAKISSFEDYARLVPNLSFASGTGINDGRQVAVRGVYGFDTTGFYIDDLPVPASLNPRIVDVDRIEVLRGPQGTLFGARSMGGTIRMVTTAPDPNAYSGKVSGEGSDLTGGTGGYQISGTVNIPLLDHRAAVRITAYNGRDGAFINREFPDPANPAALARKKVAGNDFTGFNVAGRVNFTDSFTARVTLLGQQTLLDGLPLSDYTAATLTQRRLFDIPESARDRWGYAGLSLNYTMAIGTFTSATSYFNRKPVESEDFSEVLSVVFGTPPVPASVLTWLPEQSLTEELRFASESFGPLRFIGGLYFSTDTLGTFKQYANAPGLNGASGGVLGTDLVFFEYFPHHNKEYAGFGELTYQINNAWSLTGGLRYSDVRQTIFNTSSGLAAGRPDETGSQHEHAVIPKAVIKYQPAQDLNLYALASKGFRPGGASPAPPETFCAADYAATGLTPDDLSRYKTDTLWNYELGAKTSVLDRRVQINSAIFWIDWKDIRQDARFECGYNFIVNGGAARSRGAELEISAVPVEHLNMSLGLGYTDAVITATTPELVTRVGEPVQQIAPWTASLSADYSFTISSSWKGYVRADASYTDRSFSATNDPANPRLRPSYTLANARLGALYGSWELVAFVDNIGNVHANLGDNGSEAAELPGRPRILVNPPRRYGLQAIVRF